MAMTDIERDGRGEPPRKRVNKATRALQLRLQRISTFFEIKFSRNSKNRQFSAKIRNFFPN